MRDLDGGPRKWGGESVRLLGDEVSRGLWAQWQIIPRACQQVYDGNCSQSYLIWEHTWLFVPPLCDHDIKQWWHGMYITPCRHRTCLLHAEPSSSQSVLFITTCHFFGYHFFSLSCSVALNTQLILWTIPKSHVKKRKRKSIYKLPSGNLEWSEDFANGTL